MFLYYGRTLLGLLLFFICIIFIQNVKGITIDNTTKVTSVHGVNGPRWESTVGENGLYVGWLIKNNSNPNNGTDLLLKRFSDNERTDATPLMAAQGDLKDFRIAASANKVFIIWADGTKGKEGIYLRRSIDGGNTFGVPITLVNGLHSMVLATATGVATTDKDLYIAYRNVSDNKIRIMASHDNGDNYRVTNIANTTNKEIVGMAALDN
jgi:hypothetical protein